ncbi:hypothetical protein [Mycolicibacterium confluentis]|uniref:Uncharacterized protein n=1 Tax=Mycolicibacterium confluentis TaxID=28047 RepID=A0A7I7XTJ1_9MYCO|nr:hypothetical protein [Mycolicibacterium confluentis]MCV7321259.1 hypothetical protein [Mycolicibacterium confluentis]ORV25261.1 hypothetical protein AWB99_22525 [Mycolicibacterium confluentis]BBZ32262.1 hypothetical protein MCNF_08670 [Mycolicibacterium confluentis]
MGRGLADRAARQRPDLTDDRGVDSASRVIVLALLAVDGVICAVMSALLLPLYIGVIPFPISAIVAGLVNLALVWAASQWTTETRIAALPLWTWLITAGLLTFGGPGGDIMFGGSGWRAFYPILLIAVGAAPAAWFLVRHNDAKLRRAQANR